MGSAFCGFLKNNVFRNIEKVETVINKLRRNEVNNISIINFIRNNHIISADVTGDSVMIRGKSDRVWIYISCNNIDELNVIKNKLKNDDVNFGAIDNWMVPILAKEKKFLWDIPVGQFYLPYGKSLPHIKFKTLPLTTDDARIIYNSYALKEYISLEYIADRIRKGISAGIYEDNKLVSWGLTQDDGAIGFLQTLDSYKRKSYGYNIVLSLVKKLLNKGELPFAYIEPDNDKSINLFLKLGFKENKKVHWFQIE